MDRGAWWAVVHRVANHQTRLKRLSTHACTYLYTQSEFSNHSKSGVPILWGLMPDDLRWTCCNNNRNKVHNECNVLESSGNHPPGPSPWKNCLPWNWSLVPKKNEDCYRAFLPSFLPSFIKDTQINTLSTCNSKPVIVKETCVFSSQEACDLRQKPNKSWQSVWWTVCLGTYMELWGHMARTLYISWGQNCNVCGVTGEETSQERELFISSVSDAGECESWVEAVASLWSCFHGPSTLRCPAGSRKPGGNGACLSPLALGWSLAAKEGRTNPCPHHVASPPQAALSSCVKSGGGNACPETQGGGLSSLALTHLAGCRPCGQACGGWDPGLWPWILSWWGSVLCSCPVCREGRHPIDFFGVWVRLHLWRCDSFLILEGVFLQEKMSTSNMTIFSQSFMLTLGILWKWIYPTCVV